MFYLYFQKALKNIVFIIKCLAGLKSENKKGLHFRKALQY